MMWLEWLKGWLPSNHFQLLKRGIELSISNRVSPFWNFYDSFFYRKCPCLKKATKNKIKNKHPHRSFLRQHYCAAYDYLGSIISKDGGCNKDAKNRIFKAQNVCSQLRKVQKNKKISLQTKVRILEPTMITVVKYDSEASAIQKSTC